jgi:parallel beta-helix repeat protein
MKSIFDRNTSLCAFFFAAFLVFGFVTSASAQVPPPPANLYPPDGAQIATTTQVTISWAAVPGATYYNVRANNWTNSGLRDPQNNCPNSPHYMCVNGTGATSITMPVDPGSGYGFFMHACNAAGCGDVAYANFTVASAPTLPAVPAGLSPSGVTFPFGTPSVTLSWNPVAGATSYAVRANDWTTPNARNAGNNCPGDPHYVCVNGVTTNSWSISPAAGHTYSWWVHACNPAGCSDPASATFSMAGPPQPQRVQICSIGGNPVLASNTGAEGASDAIQTCLDNGDLGAGNLWEIPKGVYLLDKQIGIRRSISIRTQGSLGTPACSRDEVDGSNCAIFKASPSLNTNAGESRLTMIYVGNGLFNGQPVIGLPVHNVSLDHMIIDGNRGARESSVTYCDGTTNAYRGGNIHFEISDDSSVTNSVTRNAVCGSGMHFIGDRATFTGNQFYANGADANSGVNLRWADGLTLLRCNSCTLSGNTFIDNTDVGLVFGGGTNTTIRNSLFEQRSRRAFAAFALSNFNNSTSGDFTQTIFEQNTITCGSGNDRRCVYGINAGEHAWFPLASHTIGGTIRFNTVANAIIGVHANGTGTASTPTSIYGNTVSGSPACGSSYPLTCNGSSTSRRVCNWVYWHVAGNPPGNSYLTLGPTPTSPPENGALSENLAGCNNF